MTSTLFPECRPIPLKFRGCARVFCQIIILPSPSKMQSPCRNAGGPGQATLSLTNFNDIMDFKIIRLELKFFPQPQSWQKNHRFSLIVAKAPQKAPGGSIVVAQPPGL